MSRETVFPRTSAAEEAEMLASMTARFMVAYRWPAGPTLWDHWGWTELPPPSSQMWPTSAARRR